MATYEQGYEAGRKGNHNNPYNYGNEYALYSEWQRGHDDGWAHYCNMIQSGG